MLKKSLVIIFVLFAPFFVYTFAHAAPNTDKWADQASKFKQRFTEQEREKVCGNIQERVNTRWNKYYDKRMQRLENLGKGLDILESRVDLFKSKDLNTSALEGDINTLKPMVDEYKVEYTKFLDLLEKAKTLPCANYNGQFISKLKDVKDQWLVVKQKSDSIKNYYQNFVKVHMQDLRSQEGDNEAN